MKTKVYVVSSQKGGAGKTTATMCIGDGLAREGKNVLILDADPQATSYKWESRPIKAYPRYPVRVEKLSGLAPIEFLKAIVAICNTTKESTGMELDYILIDTPPNLKSGDLEAALFVSDMVLVPAKPNGMYVDALEELYQLFESINTLRQKQGRQLLDVRLLINFMHSNRKSNINLVTILRKSVAMWAEKRNVQTAVLETNFKYLAAFENAPNYRTSVFNLPGSKDARDSITALVQELM